MQDNSFTTSDSHGDYVVNSIVIADPGRCFICRRRLAHFAVTFGAPYHVITHRRCAHYVNFNNWWPHPHPISYYHARDERESPPRTPSPSTGSPRHRRLPVSTLSNHSATTNDLRRSR